MVAKLTVEYRFFLSQPHNMRVLLVTNLLYSLVLPVIEIFMAAYIMRYFADTSYVAIFQVALYTGIILTSFANGFFLKRFQVAHLYSFGILLSGMSMAGMMFVRAITLTGLIVAGTLIGAASGFFWTTFITFLANASGNNSRYGHR
jgi:YQGE family putative transporter